MGRIIILALTDEEKSALEKGTRQGTSHAFRSRCKKISVAKAELEASLNQT